ncbi:MAG: hypothetical protein K9N22_03265 [Candidatus Marinimicrobia bacterium]|nr:hypothetical protein [Candidatus Neomarinimicrobiota bacterium]
MTVTAQKPFRIDDHVIYHRDDGSKKAGRFYSISRDGQIAYCRTWNPTVRGGWEYWHCEMKDLKHSGDKDEH